MKTAIVIGQAPPSKSYKIPFQGTRFYKWFEQIGFDQDWVTKILCFDALVETFPGKTQKGHEIPKQTEINLHIPAIIQKLKIDNIPVVIPVGKLAIQYVLNDFKIGLKQTVGNLFISRPFGTFESELLIIPLPHPSGASTWVYKEGNQQLLNKGLELIQASLSKPI